MASGSGSVEESRHLLRQLSHQSSSGSCVSEELDLLSNVYFEDLQISHTERGHSLTLHITPSTADDKEKQFVYLDLLILLTSQYPQTVPEVSLGQCRGLSDTHLRSISEGLTVKCEELLGCPMIYELVEYARECLTDNNLPCSQCAICQIHFQEGDNFTKTACYHYLHVACLARYVDFFERERREMEREEALVDTMLRKKPKQLECPVCRDPIASGSACLEAVRRVQPGDSEGEEAVQFVPSSELRVWQARMASLLWQQKQKGGVIDQNNKDDVIDETWVSNTARKGKKEFKEESEATPTKIIQKKSNKPTINDVAKVTTREDQRTDYSVVNGDRDCTHGKREDRRSHDIVSETADWDGDEMAENKRTFAKPRGRGRGVRNCGRYDHRGEREDRDSGCGRHRNRPEGGRGDGGGREDRDSRRGRHRDRAEGGRGDGGGGREDRDSGRGRHRDRAEGGRRDGGGGREERDSGRGRHRDRAEGGRGDGGGGRDQQRKFTQPDIGQRSRRGNRRGRGGGRKTESAKEQSIQPQMENEPTTATVDVKEFQQMAGVD